MRVARENNCTQNTQNDHVNPETAANKRLSMTDYVRKIHNTISQDQACKTSNDLIKWHNVIQSVSKNYFNVLFYDN